MLAYLKATDDLSNIILVVANLDPQAKHSGFVQLPKERLKLGDHINVKVKDLLPKNIIHGRRSGIMLNWILSNCLFICLKSSFTNLICNAYGSPLKNNDRFGSKMLSSMKFLSALFSIAMETASEIFRGLSKNLIISKTWELIRSGYCPSFLPL